MNLFYHPTLTEPTFELSDEEAQHVVKVFRYKVGDSLLVTDGIGTLAECTVLKISGKHCTLQIQSKRKDPKPTHFIHVMVAPTKSMDRLEWFVEKATELGIQKISFIETQRSERSRLNTERLFKVALAAIKQSKQTWLPQVVALQKFETALQNLEGQKFICSGSAGTPHLLKKAVPASNYSVLVGPEGDFTPTELNLALEQKFVPVSLGVNILRTETAALAACHILNVANQV